MLTHVPIGQIASSPQCKQNPSPINVMVPMTFASTIMMFAWPYAHTKGSLIVVAKVADTRNQLPYVITYISAKSGKI
jgi:hypothetical protein